MRATCRRRGDGQAIRDAMRERELNLTHLAERTRELDPDGRGVSYQLIGFLTAKGRSTRSTVSPRSAALIAGALGRPQDMLFEQSYTAMRLAGDGQPLRDAMRNQELTPPTLAALTRELDPAERGVPYRVIERLADAGEREAENISLRTAALIARALACPEDRLFEPVHPLCPQFLQKREIRST